MVAIAFEPQMNEIDSSSDEDNEVKNLTLKNLQEELEN